MPLPNLFGQSKNLVKHRKNPLPMYFRVRGMEQALHIPALILLVNPASLSTEYRKMTNTALMRGGWLEEHWGEELDTLSADGSTGGFTGQIANPGGVRRPTGSAELLKIGSDRRKTPAYRNFKSLIALYSFNAGLRARVISRGRILQFGRIELVFDNGIYEGFFESLSYNEATERPFRFEYSFSFKVTKTVIKLARSIAPANFGLTVGFGAGFQLNPGGL